jgi:hypothetical protein
MSVVVTTLLVVGVLSAALAVAALGLILMALAGSVLLDFLMDVTLAWEQRKNGGRK